MKIITEMMMMLLRNKFSGSRNNYKIVLHGNDQKPLICRQSRDRFKIYHASVTFFDVIIILNAEIHFPNKSSTIEITRNIYSWRISRIL